MCDPSELLVEWTRGPGYQPERSRSALHRRSITPAGESVRNAAYAAAGSHPMSRPANTADTDEVFAVKNRVSLGDTALLITSPIYAAYQHLDAVNVLCESHGVTGEWVGLVTSDQRPHPAPAHRQELRSTIRSSGLLLESHAGSLRSARTFPSR